MRLYLPLIAVTALITASPAIAQTCGDPNQLLAYAKDHFGETLAWTGVDAKKNRLILTKSPHGSWTLFVVGADKDGNPTACVLDSDGMPQEQGQGT